MKRPYLLVALLLANMMVSCTRAREADGLRPAIASPGASTEPVTIGRDGNVIDGVQVLDQLLAGPPLRLTTDDASSSRQFHFLCRVTSVSDSGTERMINAFIVRDASGVAALCTSADSLPYCFMTKELFVCLDPSRAGGFAIYRGGSPLFELTSMPDHGLSYNLSYVGNQPEPSIDLDISALMRSLRAKLRSTTYDIENRIITVVTERAVASISLAPIHPLAGDFPIRDFSTESQRTRSTVVVVGISSNTPAPFEAAAVTEDRVRRLGLPVRFIKEDDVRTIDLLLPLHFGRNPLEREASERLRNLLQLDKWERVNEGRSPVDQLAYAP